MSRFARATLAGIGIGAALPLVASAQARSPELLVLSKAEHVLSIVDPATHAVIARVPSGPEPHEVVASDDGTRAYISNYGTNNTLTEVDLVARRPLATIDLGALRAPHGLA